MTDPQDRIAEFRRRMARQRLEAYWLPSAVNVRYLSGFTGDESSLLVTADRAVLITDSRYLEQAENEARVDEIVRRHGPMPRAVGTLARELALAGLCVTAANLSHAEFLALRKAAPNLELAARNNGLAEQMRRRKNAGEVEIIRRALRAAEEAFKTVLPDIRSGAVEREVAARLEYRMRMAGAEGTAFDTICAADTRASVPHARTGGHSIAEHGALLVDWGARLDGYCCDLTRVVCTDRIPETLGELVEIVIEAQEAVFEKLRPGNTCGEADAAGRAVIAKAGYGEFFGHGIGHGVGLSVHETPRLGPGVDSVLLPGMVTTVEPGIYVPGQVGARIEEMVLITPDDPEVLTSLPRRPQELAALEISPLPKQPQA
jgi:Xaa-Pro aminopeptidase